MILYLKIVVLRRYKFGDKIMVHLKVIAVLNLQPRSPQNYSPAKQKFYTTFL